MHGHILTGEGKEGGRGQLPFVKMLSAALVQNTALPAAHVVSDSDKVFAQRCTHR